MTGKHKNNLIKSNTTDIKLSKTQLKSTTMTWFLGALVGKLATPIMKDTALLAKKYRQHLDESYQKLKIKLQSFKPSIKLLNFIFNDSKLFIVLIFFRRLRWSCYFFFFFFSFKSIGDLLILHKWYEVNYFR